MVWVDGGLTPPHVQNALESSGGLVNVISCERRKPGRTIEIDLVLH